MKYEGHIKTYFEMVMVITKEIIMPILSENKTEFGKSLQNTILGVEPPPKEQTNNSPYEYFVANKLFKPFVEISNTVESIENISVYVRTFPYSRYGISKVSCLKYHVENYLNELYILKNRLISYLKVINRAYLKSSITKHVSDTISPLYSIISESMKGYITIRGNHVHQNRYSDPKIDRLSSLELLSLGQDEFGKTISQIYSNAYKETRKKWVKRISEDLEGIHTLLNIYFEVLIKAISYNGIILIPDNIEKT